MKKSGEPVSGHEDKNADSTLTQRQFNGNSTLTGTKAVLDESVSDPNSTLIERQNNNETSSPPVTKVFVAGSFREEEDTNNAAKTAWDENANSTVTQRQFNGNSMVIENSGVSDLNDYAKSEFINTVSELVDERGYDERFSSPFQYWSAGKAELVKNINIYVRCLLESTLKLSRYKSIPVSDLLNLANAYAHIIHSEAFEKLGYEYPYHETLQHIYIRLSRVYKRFRNNSKLRLVLGFEKKTELIAMLHEIGDTVPLRKFSELFHSAKEQR
jgi:hypothetical protein